MFKKFLPVLFLPLLWAGCATQFTNLTPQQQVRSTNNLYLVEVALASSQQTLRWETIQPWIIVGKKPYPMHPTMLMSNRWEGLLPVMPGASAVNYRYRFDYDYNAWGKAKQGSSLSSEYTLRVLEP